MSKGKADEFDQVFEELKAILQKHESKLLVLKDEPKQYYLNTNVVKDKKPVCFGAVAVMKSYVSYYLMPVYYAPELLEDVSDKLKAHMQGKSCFNFKSVEPKVFKELAKLTKASYDHFKKTGLV